MYIDIPLWRWPSVRNPLSLSTVCIHSSSVFINYICRGICMCLAGTTGKRFIAVFDPSHGQINLWHFTGDCKKKQECIPVGCVPAARRPYAGVCFLGGCGPGGWVWSGSGGVSAPGGWSGPRGCLLQGGLVPGGVCSRGGVWSRGEGWVWSGPRGEWYPTMHWSRTPPVNRMTNRCKNITLATTSLRPVIKNTKINQLIMVIIVSIFPVLILSFAHYSSYRREIGLGNSKGVMLHTQSDRF